MYKVVGTSTGEIFAEPRYAEFDTLKEALSYIEDLLYDLEFDIDEYWALTEIVHEYSEAEPWVIADYFANGFFDSIFRFDIKRS